MPLNAILLPKDADPGLSVVIRKITVPCDRKSYIVCGFFFNKFIYLFIFLAALGLRRCTQAFSSCGEWGLLFIVVCGLLIAVASLIAEHGL